MMDALWLEDQKLEYCKSLPEPNPSPGEALIKVNLAGICSTDLELVKGYYPFTGVPGHEFVGVVISSPSDDAWVGKRVVGEINIACGECRMCKTGLPRHCEHRRTLGIHDWDGAFARYLVLPLENLHEVPGNLSDDQAVFTEPTAAAYEILEQVPLQPQNSVLVIGAGRLGQLVAQVLQTTGCELEVVARHPKQKAVLADKNIRTTTEGDLANKKYDLVIEATGSPKGYQLAARYVRPRGTIVIKSTYKGNVEVNFSKIVVDEVNLVGSRCGPFEPALQLLAEGRVDPKLLIEAIYPLNQGVRAFSHSGQSGTLKVLIQAG
jgi:2-desacetyl-2-hydroxyethyl bacteriochlorophyllide A dehydrogenase